MAEQNKPIHLQNSRLITYITGDLLAANTEALVNAVNTVGVMGKGIALQFKEAFTENFKHYQAAAKAGELQTGKMFVTATHRSDGVKWIVNFPTKAHWRNSSKLSYIEAGLDDLVNVINNLHIKSIALPPLGCGNGGLDWTVVKPLLAVKLGGLDDVEVQVYEPVRA